MAKQRKKYTEEFKQDAVRLMRNRGERTEQPGLSTGLGHSGKG